MEELAREAESHAAKVRAVLIDPKDEARRPHAARPLTDHLTDWQSHLIAKGYTPKHAGLSLDRVRRVAALIVGAYLGDATPSRRTERDRINRRLDDHLTPARLSDLTRDQA